MTEMEKSETPAAAVKERKARFVITEEDKKKFLEALASFPSVKRAAEIAGFTNIAFYQQRQKDPEFRKAWKEAIAECRRAAEAEAYRRAVLGNEKNVFYQGKVCGKVTEFSDVLLIFYLKSHLPEIYGDKNRIDLTNSDGKLRPVVVNMPDAEKIELLIDRFDALPEGGK